MINLGHDAADEVLITAAQRIADCLNTADTLCRYGGDEFVVLLGETHRPEDAANVAKKLQSAMAGPEVVAGQAVDLSRSIEVSVYPDDGEDLHTLVQKADRAMFQSKTAIRYTEMSANGR